MEISFHTELHSYSEIFVNKMIRKFYLFFNRQTLLCEVFIVEVVTSTLCFMVYASTTNSCNNEIFLAYNRYYHP